MNFSNKKLATILGIFLIAITVVGCAPGSYENDNTMGSPNNDMNQNMDNNEDMDDQETAEITALGRFFVSSNTSQTLGVYDIMEDDTVMSMTYPSDGVDADGLYYNDSMNILYQLNRSDSILVSYDNILETLAQDNDPMVSMRSTSDFTNGRGITWYDDMIVVAQDGSDANDDQNRLVVYSVGQESIDLENTYDVDFNLWGVEATDDMLYAIIDNSNQVAVFEDLLDNEDGTVVQDETITVVDLVRTHGIAYYEADDLVILTDVGEADSDTDGAVVVVQNFSDAVSDNRITTDEQIRIAGPNSLLGNPVDVAYSPANNMILVAERANGGGRVLGFSLPSESGDMTPMYMDTFEGASSIEYTNDI